MGKNTYKVVLLILFLTFSQNYAQQLAFPGAEGYGKYTVGGRGGTVYEVTNLNDSGPGSLRAAVTASGPRIVVFRVSGTITLNSDLKISNPYITIAGQTAPGDGICLRKYSLVLNTGVKEVIIRYIRVRLGNESGGESDAVSGRGCSNVILDHVSASWSVDETMSVYFCENITIQWSMIAESLFNSNHPKGVHGFGGIWGSNNSTSHHNLIAHHSSRNPRISSGCGNFDYRNNVVYNWGYNSTYGGEDQQVGDAAHYFSKINMVANYYKPGPATTPGGISYRLTNPSFRTLVSDYGDWYLSDNIMEGNTAVTTDNWNGGVQPSGGSGDIQYLKLANPWPAMPFNQQTATDAYYSVLDNVGATLPKRDPVDTHIVHDARFGDATYEGVTYETLKTVKDKTKNCGIIDLPSDVGGWPVLNSTVAPTDTDHDGMPDAWETAKGLNPNDGLDRNIVGTDGYTNLEKYLNSIEFNYPVTDYTLMKLSDTSFKLGWADNYIAETGFKIERSYNNGPFVAIASLPTYANNFTDNAVNLTGMGLVTYRVIAFNADNASPNTTSISNAPAVPVPVTGVSVLPASTTINTGSSTQLVATIVPSNADNKNVTWSSSNSAIATVSTTGKVTGVAEGLATITATTVDGSFTASSIVTVLIKPATTASGLIILGFNENTGNTVINDGTAVATFTKTVIPNWSTNVPTNGGDSSVDYGTITGNYYVESDAVVSELAGLTSFTITGWVNCKDLAVGSGGNRIVSWIYNGANGVDVVHAADGSLKVGINQWPDSSTAISSLGKITADPNASSSNWKFFSITYDSAASTLQFYFGDNTIQASLDKSVTYNQGAVGSTIGKLAIGHFNAESSRSTRTNRMFKGLIDQIGIYNTALSSDDIQKIQNISGLSLGQRGTLGNTVTLYPNPVTKLLTIGLGKVDTADTVVQLFNLEGKLIAKDKVEGNTYFLNMENLNSGVYIVKVSNAKGNVVKRVIKQ